MSPLPNYSNRQHVSKDKFLGTLCNRHKNVSYSVVVLSMGNVKNWG